MFNFAKVDQEESSSPSHAYVQWWTDKQTINYLFKQNCVHSFYRLHKECSAKFWCKNAGLLAPSYNFDLERLIQTEAEPMMMWFRIILQV